MANVDGKMMKDKNFYKLYIPALISAFDNENNCEQYNVKGPDFYIKAPKDIKVEIIDYIEKETGKNKFLDSVAYYFDAKSHGFPDIQGVNIHDYKEMILNEITIIRKQLNI
jgi:hypothetical protein